MAIARLLVFLVGIATIHAQLNGRILDGEEASSGQFPWVASVRLDNVHTCVGNIISDKIIVTAAHCVSVIGTTPYENSRINCRVGSTNQYASGNIVTVNKITIHPSYGNFLHDIALIELAERLTWSNKVKSIALAAEDTEIPDDSEVTVNGWGLQQSGASPYKLQHTKLRSLDPPECEYRAGFGYPSVLCLSHDEKKGICRGDDGAGAVFNDLLVGIGSFAFGTCGTKYPDIFARVSYYRNWIDGIVKA